MNLKKYKYIILMIIRILDVFHFDFQKARHAWEKTEETYSK